MNREIDILAGNASLWRRRLAQEAERFEVHARRYSHEPEIARQSIDFASRCREAAKLFEIKEESNV